MKAADTLKRFFRVLGPGLITGASDDDPSGIATYATAGASLGYGPLWLMLVTVPMMVAVQFICAKVGLATGIGLAGVLRRHYPKPLLYAAMVGLVVANTINIGADIAAIGAGIGLLVPIPGIWFVVPVTLALTAFLVFGTYDAIVRIFKWLTLALFTYIGAAVLAKPSWLAVLHGTLVPTLSLNGQFLTVLVAVLGTTISPYLFFWQASEEAEEVKTKTLQAEGLTKEPTVRRRPARDRRSGLSDAEVKMTAVDTGTGMFLSNLVAYFIILATAAALFTAGKHDVNSAADAASALRPLAGDAAYFLFAVGIIGSGVLAVPILAGSAAYAVSEAFHWRFGLDQKPYRAKQFYGVIILSMLVGMAINFLGIDPMTALVGSAVVNGLMSPLLLVVIMLVANNQRIMGGNTNGRLTNAVGWLTTGVMALAAVAMVFTLFQ